MTSSTPPATVVQFNLRSLLIAMVAFMVVLGATSPLVLSWSPTRQRFFLGFMLSNLAATGVWILLHARRRRRSERAAGAVMLRVVGRWATVMRFSSLLFGLFVAAILVHWAYISADIADTPLASELAEKHPWSLLMVIINLATMSFFLSRCTCNVWWNAWPWSLEIYENGLIISGHRVCLFSTFTDVRWNARRPDRLQIKRGGRGWWGQMVIPPEQREKIETIIRDRIASAQSP